MNTARSAVVDGRVVADEFFLRSGSEQLAKIYHWARARYAAPWAVLFGVLLRVSASVPPFVQLPPVIGGRASLNLFCAFVGKSGSGKGISDSVAREAWPAEIMELTLGSGEGIAAQFASGLTTQVLFTVPEVDKLTGIAGRSGSILLAELKSAAMGEAIGQANAREETSRLVCAHSYRMGLSVGVQPGHTGVIFNDTTGGTPQRLLWAPTTDPDMPRVVGDVPAPLTIDIPTGEAGEDGVVEMVYVAPEIRETVIDAHLSRQRGEGDALDGHLLLLRCKVAATLALMHGRFEITEWDWVRSGEVMLVSEQTRAGLLEAEAAIREAEHLRRGENDALRHEGRENFQLESVKKSVVATLVKRGGSASASDLNTALGKPHRRRLLTPALTALGDAGRVIATRVPGGIRYQLADPVQDERTVQGALPQVIGGERSVQDERGAAVISKETRMPALSGKSRVSCQKWFDSHLDTKRAEGYETINAVAVREAGIAAGYSKNSLYVAANARGLKGSTWALTDQAKPAA